MSLKSLIVVLLIAYSITEAYAIPPPDLIIQATAQIWQFIVIGWALLVGIIGMTRQYLRALYLRHKRLILPIIWSMIALLVVGYAFYRYLV